MPPAGRWAHADGRAACRGGLLLALLPACLFCCCLHSLFVHCCCPRWQRVVATEAATPAPNALCRRPPPSRQVVDAKHPEKDMEMMMQNQ